MKIGTVTNIDKTMARAYSWLRYDLHVLDSFVSFALRLNHVVRLMDEAISYKRTSGCTNK